MPYDWFLVSREAFIADFHRNIFYYYRGPEKKGHERQLENNTTKALINTLDHCSWPVKEAFLDWLGIATSEPVKFELQRATIEPEIVAANAQRLFLGLVPSGEDTGAPERMGVVPGDKDSCPDAWIYGPGFVVLVESKVTGGISDTQRRLHVRKLEREIGQPPREAIRTWDSAHRFFLDLATCPRLTEKDRWIIGQFMQYLEWQGLAQEFAGFEPMAFECFAAQSDKDARPWARGVMRTFAPKVLELLKGYEPFYQGYDVGLIRPEDRHCWVAFGPRGKEYRQWAHLTVALNEKGLDVFVNVELAAAISLLRERLQREQERFRDLVAGLPDPFHIEVQTRKRREREVRVYDSHCVRRFEAARLKSAVSGGGDFQQIEVLLTELWQPSQNSYPYFTVVRPIDKIAVISRSAENHGGLLVEDVVSIMRTLSPIVRFINEPDYTLRKRKTAKLGASGHST